MDYSSSQKRYDLKPQLLDIHVDRMIEAHKVAHTYLTNTELLRSGLLRFEKFMGAVGEIGVYWLAYNEAPS